MEVKVKISIDVNEQMPHIRGLYWKEIAVLIDL